jgi:hypothetical protein
MTVWTHRKCNLHFLTAAADAGPLESGSTITIAKLVDAKHLVESTNYNAVLVAQHTRKDSAKLIAEYWGHGVMALAAIKASTHSWSSVRALVRSLGRLPSSRCSQTAASRFQVRGPRPSRAC